MCQLTIVRIPVWLKKSKTHQFSPQDYVVIGITGLPLSPVTAIVQYIAERAAPFFLNPSKTALTKPQFISCLRAPVFHSMITSHSFRTGAATTAATEKRCSIPFRLGGARRTLVRLPLTTIAVSLPWMEALRHATPYCPYVTYVQ